jgi:hypothetical protein
MKIRFIDSSTCQRRAKKELNCNNIFDYVMKRIIYIVSLIFKLKTNRKQTFVISYVWVKEESKKPIILCEDFYILQISYSTLIN